MISTLAAYQFRLADHYASLRKYIGKVTFTAPPSRSYSFVYIPYGRNSSILMLDYLIANRKSMPADVQESLEEMIRYDTRPANPMELVVVSDRPSIKESSLFEEAPDADRIIRSPLQVARQIHFSDRLKSVKLDKFNPATMSVRLDKDQLYIDLPKDNAVRTSSAKASIMKKQGQGNRTDLFRANPINQLLTGERPSILDLLVMDKRSEGKRVFLAPMTVHHERGAGTRFSSRDLFIDISTGQAIRITDHPLFVDQNNHVAKRHVHFRLTSHLIQLFERLRAKTTTVLRDMDWAYLKARQYESMLHFLDDASRFEKQDLMIQHVMNAHRTDNQIGSVFHDRFSGYRHFLNALSINADTKQGSRAYKQDLVVNSSQLRANRPIQAIASLLIDFAKGQRHYITDLAILSSRLSGQRTIQTDASLLTYFEQSLRIQNEPLFIPRTLYSSQREKISRLWTPQPFQYGQKQLSRPSSIRFDDMRGDRNPFRVTHLWERNREIDYSGSKAPKPSFLSSDEEIYSSLDSIRQGILDDELIAHIQNSRDASLEEIMLALVTRERDSIIAEEIILATILREMPAHILEDILASKEFPSYLMDEMIFASRFSDGQSIVEVLIEWALTQKSFAAQIDEEFISGVRTRIQALIDSDVMIATTSKEHPGILSFDTLQSTRPSEVTSHIDDGLTGDQEASPSYLEEDIVGEDEFRPAVLSIKHPFGYMDPDPSYLFEDQDADKSQHPSELDEPVTGLLRSRLTELCSGYLFGTSPHERTSYILELYELAESCSRTGEILDDEWTKYALLALEQAIVHEQMFAYNPEAASVLFESILGFKQPDPAVVNIDWIASDQKRAASLITEIVGKKELADAILMEYLLGQKERQKGHLEQPIFSVHDFKKAWMDRIEEVGQGFIFDYSNDILEAEHDPEHWSGGFAVPEAYDPHDPFNEYYPWTTDLNALALGQDDWKRFGSGKWELDPLQGKFISTSGSSGMGGYYRNDFTYTDYQFEVNFKVDNPLEDDTAGIIFKYLNDRNYWMFVVSGGTARGMARPMQLFKVENGISTLYATPMNPFAWEKGKWYTLRVIVTGNRIRVWVDYNLQYDFTD
ncbi:DUF1080 domain-containing protein [Brevibacillus reuszeri]|nr:DUF1080 domain-containing protein [Brevibacillus reuszeri]MED1856221.1 DUF1080 domain-containing protein [Brevibacillus reuszeri]